MFRLISIILILFLIGIIVVKKVRKSLEQILKQNFTPNVKKDDKDEVIYRDDEVVVLKGESGKKQDK